MFSTNSFKTVFMKYKRYTVYLNSSLADGKGVWGVQEVENLQEVGGQTPRDVGDHMVQPEGALGGRGRSHIPEVVVDRPLEEGVQNWVPRQKGALGQTVAVGRLHVGRG